jgi:hypothetical protein
MVKRGGGLIYFDFVSKEGVLERGLKERGLNIEITVPPFLPLPSKTCCRRGQLQGLKHGFQGQCIACYVPGNME